MTEAIRPADPDELRDAIAWAAAEKLTLKVLAGASKRGLGRPVQAAASLDLSGLSGIVLYEPEELVLTARAATPMAEVEAALGEARQQLTFEPPDLGPLLGAAAGGATLGGIVACNLAGPRRIQTGSARDNLLGFAGVSGRGEVFKSGGRVVKNVTGFDLSKLMAGSHGTLAAMSEVTLKVMPAAEQARTVVIAGFDDAAAVTALGIALQSPYEVSGAAHLPAPCAARSGVELVSGAGASVTAIRVEGPEPSVAARTESLCRLLAEFDGIEELHTVDSTALWREVRDVAPLFDLSGQIVWRLSVPPADGPAVVRRIARSGPVEAFYDWGGGLVWLAVPETETGSDEVVRAAVTPTGGHATLMRAPEGVRASVPVFQPQADALADLTRRVKEGFDPLRVLNPGRMYVGV